MFTIKTKAATSYDVSAKVAIISADDEMLMDAYSANLTTKNTVKIKKAIREYYTSLGAKVLGISDVTVSAVEGETLTFKFDISRSEVIGVLKNAGYEPIAE